MDNYASQEQEQMDEVNTQDTNSQEQSLRAYVDSTNIAEELDDEELTKIGADCAAGLIADLQSRKDWEDNLKQWTDLALQVKVDKVWPWVGASNVKYPLLSTAAMQFNARAYPSLIPATGKIVKCDVAGKDPQGTKHEQADRVATFMSYQILNCMRGWEQDMDQLLVMLPITGSVFKKTYYDAVIKENCSDLVLPKNLVVDYYTKDLCSAERISEIIFLNKRQIKERQMSGIFLDKVDLGDPTVENLDKDNNAPVTSDDQTTPYQIIEQHCFLDLDNDGYAEPYIVTFEKYTQKVLRIIARFDETTIHVNEEGKLQRIEPIHYYTKFGFIPNPDGGFYDIGFGLLLSPINESVNTLINQLIDSGTLANLQGGFLGKGMKLKMGESSWQPGEWKTVQTVVDDLRKQVMPLPMKEPSKVLFELMGTLVTSGKELASVAEIFVGKMPGQNTPATTTMATIEQGMKVFTAVYKRLYRALKEEYNKLFRLNKVYLSQEKYQEVLDIPATLDDFDAKTYNIAPNADPSTATQQEKLMKAQALMEIIPLGTLDPLEITMRLLDAQEQPNPQKLLKPEIQQTGQFQPPPDPKLQEMQAKMQMEQQRTGLKVQETQQNMALEQRDREAQLAMKAQEHAQNMEVKRQEALIDGQIALHKQRIFSVAEQMKNQQQAATGAQQMVHKEQLHSQKMAQQKEMAKSKKQQTKTSSKTGKRTQ